MAAGTKCHLVLWTATYDTNQQQVLIAVVLDVGNLYMKIFTGSLTSRKAAHTFPSASPWKPNVSPRGHDL